MKYYDLKERVGFSIDSFTYNHELAIFKADKFEFNYVYNIFYHAIYTSGINHAGDIIIKDDLGLMIFKNSIIKECDDEYKRIQFIFDSNYRLDINEPKYYNIISKIRNIELDSLIQ